MQETVLVTGSSGRMGSAVSERLAPRYHVVGFDRAAPPNAHAGAEHIRVDVRSEGSLRSGLEELRRRYGAQLASVLHLAEYHDCWGTPSPRYQEVNVRGTERLLLGLRGFRVGQFVLASTVEVHAPCRPRAHVTEDSPLAPSWVYPRSKLRAEEAVRALHADIPYVLVRLAAVYDDACHYPPLARQIQRILERRRTSHVFPGNARHGRPFVHRDDAADLFERLVEHRAELPPELALVAGEPLSVSYRDLQTTLGRLLHHEEWQTHEVSKGLARMSAWLQDHLPFVEEPPFPPRLLDQTDAHYALDIGRAYRLLGWEPRHALRDVLPAMIERLRDNPRAWYQVNGLKVPANLRGTPAGQGVAS